MNTALWAMQGLLALVFLTAGISKLVQPTHKVRQLVPLPFPMWFVRLLAGLEVLAAGGIILPWLTGILPGLTPSTALAMSGVLAGALLVHTRQRDWAKLPFLGVMLVVALLVAYARFESLSSQ